MLNVFIAKLICGIVNKIQDWGGVYSRKKILFVTKKYNVT